MNYLYHLIIYLCVYIIVAVSLNIVTGYCGLLTLAHAGYFAVGCYVYALSSLLLGWGLVLSMLLAFGVAAIFSLAVSIPSWRFKGDFFVMSSLAVQALLYSLFYNWSNSTAALGTWSNLTNGPSGIAGIPKLVIFGIKFDTLGGVAVISVILAVVWIYVSALLLSSPWGRLLKAMRDDELAARGLGKNVQVAKTQAFAIACGIAAIAGVIYAAYVSYVDPSIASLDESILMLCMVIVGGMGNIQGPVVGALVLIAIPELLRFADIPNDIAPNIRLMVYGLLLLAMMHFRPQGLAGSYRIE